jgi:hypothetical protein
LGVGAHGLEGEVVAVPALGDPQAEVEGRPSDLLGRFGGPHVQTSPSGPVSSTRTSAAGRSRASRTSTPCAQVSISRAVAKEGALMSGPNQGRVVPGGSAVRAEASAARDVRHRASSSGGEVAAPAAAAASTAAVTSGAPATTSVRNPSGSVAARSATSSVHRRLLDRAPRSFADFAADHAHVIRG